MIQVGAGIVVFEQVRVHLGGVNWLGLGLDLGHVKGQLLQFCTVKCVYRSRVVLLHM